MNKITRVETIINENETRIQQINFYSGQERINSVGRADDYWVRDNRGRTENFYISEDEQLIGCELSHDAYFKGVTWMKINFTIYASNQS